MSTADLAYAVGSAIGSYYGSRRSSMAGSNYAQSFSSGSNGITRRNFAGSAKARGKRFNLGKLLRSTVYPTEQQLCLIDENTGLKYTDALISEYNPGTGGMVPICMDSGNNYLPMHVYDLNFVQTGLTLDSVANYTTSATDQNSDVNHRAWDFRNDNKFYALQGKSENAGQTTNIIAPRWRIYQNEFASSSLDNRRVYMKDIKIDYMFYGCSKMETEYDIRVIKIFDPKMCPDYEANLIDTSDHKDLTTFRERWQTLVRHYTTNPLYKQAGAIRPTGGKKWFKTVVKRRIRVNEQSADADQVQCVQGSLYVPVNEVRDHMWSLGTEFPSPPGGDAAYDNALNDAGFVGDTASITPMEKKQYRCRYYLLIRALSPMDLSRPPGAGFLFNQDGNTAEVIADTDSRFVRGGRSAVQYTPTYDLGIRTKYMRMIAF